MKVVTLATVLLCATPAAAQLFPCAARPDCPLNGVATPAPVPVPVFALPDPAMTPGAIDPNVTLEAICNGTTRARRHSTTKLCDRALAAYSIGAEHRYEYECDHLIPLALGGTNALPNLWPPPNVEAERKDRLEVAMQAVVCRGALPLAQAQREIADDWTGAERRYGDGR